MKLPGFLTDSQERASIEALMGFLFLVAALVHAFWKSDPVMFGAIAGVGTTLLVTYSVGNNNLDRNTPSLPESIKEK